jgi:predicted  nucleic acid-binding Zn-ribbon protein
VALNLKGRLRALERTVVRVDEERCHACGGAPGDRIEFTLSFGEFDGPDKCPGCGRLLVVRLRFDDPLGTRP